MNQEIIIKYGSNTLSSMIRDEKNSAILRNSKEKMETGSINNVYQRARPYLSADIKIQDSLVTGMTLGIANPPQKVCGSLVGKRFEVSLAYSNIKDGRFMYKSFLIFNGMVIQPPYFRDGGAGTDQILYIPLALATLPTKIHGNEDNIFEYQQGEKLHDVLQRLIKQNGFSSVKKFEYSPESLKEYRMTSSNKFSLFDTTFSSFSVNLERTENGIKIFANLDTLIIYNNDGLKEGLLGTSQNSKSGNNAGLIYNNSNQRDIIKKDKSGNIIAQAQRVKWQKGKNNQSYVDTFLRTKYAVVGLDNSVNIELAFVLPNLIGKRYCVIQNIGQNINIFGSLSSEYEGKMSGNKAFYIQRQDIFFSTWGDSKHTLNLMAQPKENYGITLEPVSEEQKNATNQ